MGRSLSFKQSDQGTLVIGGGLQGIPDLDRETSTARMRVLAKGAHAATDLFPAVRDIRIVRVWAGLEAKTDDMLPVVGPSPSTTLIRPEGRPARSASSAMNRVE